MLTPQKATDPTSKTTLHAASGRSRMGSLSGIRISATGSYVPQQIVTNRDLAELGCDSDWIVARTGILERRKASDTEATSDLAWHAIVDCLENAGLDPHDVDLLICATITPDFLTPSTACLLQNRLGCIAPAFDINAACAGFMVGMITAAQFIAAGTAKNALVVGSDLMSRTIDKTDIRTYPLFGDGAGAALLQPCDAEPMNGFIRFCIGSEGTSEPLCIPGGGSREPLTPETIDAGKQFLRMDGRTVFKWAVRVVEDSLTDVLESANISPDEINLVILHQANIRILEAAINKLDIPKERMFVNLDRYGNTSAASVPLALDQANKAGKLHRGDLVLMCGFGAGLSWGTTLVRW